MHSAIQLLDHQFSKIELHPTDADSPEGDLTGAQTLTLFREAETLWRVKLHVEFYPADLEAPAPYTGSVDVIGTFELHPDFPEEKCQAMVALNAGAILYGAVRELVLNLTARSLHGMMSLPTIDVRSFLPLEDATQEDAGEAPQE